MVWVQVTVLALHTLLKPVCVLLARRSLANHPHRVIDFLMTVQDLTKVGLISLGLGLTPQAW